MASVESLHARIEELSAAVNHHEEIIRGLEKAKSEARGQLNGILDPLTKCPLEISSDIFPLHSVIQSPHISPGMPLMARYTPSLWAAIRLESPCKEGSRKVLDTWFNGAAGLPLSLTGSLQGDRTVPALVKRHAHRFQNLQLNLLSGKELEGITMPFVSLKSLTISQGSINKAPQRYREETLTNVTIHSYDPSECVEMLCAAPNLVECTLKGIQHEVNRHSYNAFPMQNAYSTHLCLKHLRLGTEGYDYSSTAEISKHLTLPALESLSITSFDISQRGFLAFLTRSSPPLQSLGSSIPSYSGWETADAEGIFRLIPNLTHVELGFLCSYYPSNEAFECLVIHSLRETSLLPHLRTLTIYGYVPNHPEFQELANALLARSVSESKMSLKLFWDPSIAQSLRWEKPPRGKSEDHVVLAFQELVADGIDIHVGPKENNLVDMEIVVVGVE